MGKFLSTTYHDTVENLTGFYNTLVNNSFYTLNDKRPTICTYYNIHKDYSSLDPGSKLQYDNIGANSPIRYNRIFDMILYGFDRIELNADNGEFGLEDNTIEGDCYILPNTIIPTEGDYFEIDHIKSSTWLFIVKDVQQDTLENGSNAYKISYKLEYLDHNEILEKVVHNYRYIEVQEGTNIARIVRNEDYEIAKKMDDKAVQLKRYFQELFYNDKVQTYTFMDLYNFRMYDPFMIEFLIRNKIMENNSESYIYVTHQIATHKTFSIDYDKSIYRAFEKKDKDNILEYVIVSDMETIKSYGTTFSSRYESYYKLNYLPAPPNHGIAVFDEDLIFQIIENKKEEYIPTANGKSTMWKNIIIKYFNDETLTEEDIDAIDDIELKEASSVFYNIPYLIFCLEKYIEKILSEQKLNKNEQREHNYNI